MRKFVKRSLAALLATFILTGTVACSGTGTHKETNPKETIGTGEGTTAEVTDTTMDTEAETQPLAGDFTVSEKDGVASITTATGLSYDATGYETVDPETGIITFKGDMLLTLTTDVVATKFNRFTMTYIKSITLE